MIDNSIYMRFLNTIAKETFFYKHRHMDCWSWKTLEIISSDLVILTYKKTEVQVH